MVKNLGFLQLTAALAFASATVCLHAQTKTPARKTASSTTQSGPKLPANIPPAHGLLRTEYALRYIDIKVGTGAVAEPSKIYVVHYTGWLHDGTKFDSSVDRGEPIEFPQGAHRVIPGWDTGFEGMRIGGKRRLFIPWELAYGAAGRGPIPPKADLIFDVELVSVKDLPQAMGMPGHFAQPPATPPAGAQPATPPSAAQPTTPPPTAAPAAPTQPAQPGTPPPASEPK